MAGNGKVFADGQLPNSKTTLYTVPQDRIAYIRFFSIYNTDASSRVCTIYVNTSGTSRCIYREDVAANTGTFILQGESIILEAGDSLEGLCATANVVDYYICGVEEV